MKLPKIDSSKKDSYRREKATKEAPHATIDENEEGIPSSPSLPSPKRTALSSNSSSHRKEGRPRSTKRREERDDAVEREDEEERRYAEEKEKEKERARLEEKKRLEEKRRRREKEKALEEDKMRKQERVERRRQRLVELQQQPIEDWSVEDCSDFCYLAIRESHDHPLFSREDDEERTAEDSHSSSLKRKREKELSKQRKELEAMALSVSDRMREIGINGVYLAFAASEKEGGGRDRLVSSPFTLTEDTASILLTQLELPLEAYNKRKVKCR